MAEAVMGRFGVTFRIVVAAGSEREAIALARHAVAGRPDVEAIAIDFVGVEAMGADRADAAPTAYDGPAVEYQV